MAGIWSLKFRLLYLSAGRNQGRTEGLLLLLYQSTYVLREKLDWEVVGFLWGHTEYLKTSFGQEPVEFRIGKKVIIAVKDSSP